MTIISDIVKNTTTVLFCPIKHSIVAASNELFKPQTLKTKFIFILPKTLHKVKNVFLFRHWNETKFLIFSYSQVACFTVSVLFFKVKNKKQKNRLQ